MGPDTACGSEGTRDRVLSRWRLGQRLFYAQPVWLDPASGHGSFSSGASYLKPGRRDGKSPWDVDARRKARQVLE